jgi:hypothetical protein
MASKVRQLYILAIMALISHYCFSQNQANNWVFGDSAGLNFNTGSPDFFESGIRTFEACASISDSAGNLLFYTNGDNVWNKLNEVMPNGDSLEIGGISGAYPSSNTQGVVIFPMPLSILKYYIFYLSDAGLMYSIVDMSLNSYEGDVIDKNLLIFNIIDINIGLSEKMQAIKHGNGKDWWLILCSDPVGGYVNGNPYKWIKYLITSMGIEGPFYQDYEPTYNEDDGLIGLGQMKFSQDGSKLMYTRGKHLDIYDFDRCTGEFSNFYTIENVTDNYLYGCEFSPDASKIYVAAHGEWERGYIYQYCIGTDIDITETQTLIYDNEGGGGSWGKSVAQFQIAPDNKIYIAMPYSGLGYYDLVEQNLNLSVINNPNEAGLACDFDTLSVYLGDKRATYALPNMPNYNLGALAGSECDTIGTAVNNIPEINNEIIIYPNPAASYFMVDVEGGYNEDYSIDLFNLLGTKVYEANNIKPQLPIYINSIKNGIYHVLISSDSQAVYSGTLIILK